MTTLASILEQAPTVAAEWAEERADRQQRTKADPADYARLAEIGVPLMAVPTDLGGTWESIEQSARPICSMLRKLAVGDPSITLASAMHHLVLASWRLPTVPEPFTAGWIKQRNAVFDSVHSGCWWGTIVSEPGSGGDTSRTASVCEPDGESDFGYRISGQKHFGSGSGLTSFMTTRALAAGETAPDLFFMEVRNHPWDGSTGLKLTAEWRGHGMKSTNSHAFEFSQFPATRVAWPNHQAELMGANGGLGAAAFTSVIVGVVDAAMDHVRPRIKNGMASDPGLRAFQQVEWAHAEQEAWLIGQAWEGAIRCLETNTGRRELLLAKESVARLAEDCLGRLCKLSGGSAYTRYSPLSVWYDDVRALGYLRPPWALAWDQVFQQSLAE